ncbi:M-phase phosphoprotein 6 [Cephus cinctus]|uniref:M-phase phosphoprotein 6 n=1 Tax=Cephus cinctus TaxID=211228 RepID=A0AAJ7FKM7_CEPCN|nr:M-phase phosphoprotein 6 [Cephus cinctus]
MTGRDHSKAKLSKGILEMKFMKRTKEKVEKQQFQEEGEEYFENLLTTRMKSEKDKFIIEPSFTYCEKLIDGRLSFQGMNPDIERLMEIENESKRVMLEKKKETDISDEQMARHISRGVNPLSRHRKEKKYIRRVQVEDEEPIPKKPKFLKPVD